MPLTRVGQTCQGSWLRGTRWGGDVWEASRADVEEAAGRRSVEVGGEVWLEIYINLGVVSPETMFTSMGMH